MHTPRQSGVPKLDGSPTLPRPKLHTASRMCSQCSKQFVAPTGKSKVLFHGHTLFCTARCHTAWANARNVVGVVKTVWGRALTLYTPRPLRPWPSWCLRGGVGPHRPPCAMPALDLLALGRGARRRILP